MSLPVTVTVLRPVTVVGAVSDTAVVVALGGASQEPAM